MMKRRFLTLFTLLLILLSLCSGCGAQGREAERSGVTGTMELLYAQQFSVDYLADGNALLTIGEDHFLIDRTGNEDPEKDGIPRISLPQERIYLASSSAGDLFDKLGALDSLRATSTNAENWRIPSLKEAVGSEKILYAGKYSAPDFELLLSEDCSLAIENTMIYHNPDIKEKLESLGIPVIVERSSYEAHPLGRVEWIKLYGLLTGKEKEAEAFFQKQLDQVKDLENYEKTGKTVAFFHINTSGSAVIRKPGDYVSRMIELAGGSYVFSDLKGEENALSTMNMQMEAFYAGAKDADILIYNSTIDGEIYSIAQLLEKSGLLADFKAVKTGNVWCTEQSMFQQTSAAAGMISDIRMIVTGEADGMEQLTFLHRLQ